MDILFDTHILLWHLEDDSRLKPEKSDIIEEPLNRIFISVASLWEIAIKRSIGKLSIKLTLEQLTPNPIALLPIQIAHLRQVELLHFHHSDPFDRLIIAQAKTEDFFVMTDDPHFKNYPIKLV